MFNVITGRSIPHLRNDVTSFVVLVLNETLAAFECEHVIIGWPAFVHERVTIGQLDAIGHGVRQ